ncbi:VOC family protein [Massilia aquatica]|uniref:VOC family protein n=1 Tax=Massilia aquatica TaxID=2609000 RepID=A0ABX0LZK5_9BURK|nr:VOC family protein [Massilia aquatica]NHZ39399.1 VOC family protein [Massilia aquatica]
MLDHLFLSVADMPAAIAFYERALAPLGIAHVHDYKGSDGPPGHPDLKGFGSANRIYFWLREGTADARAVHIGFVADSAAAVDAFYAAARRAGGADNGAPGARLHYDPRYYAANIFDLDGYSIEVVYKSWQHRQPSSVQNVIPRPQLS